LNDLGLPFTSAVHPLNVLIKYKFLKGLQLLALHPILSHFVIHFMSLIAIVQLLILSSPVNHAVELLLFGFILLNFFIHFFNDLALFSVHTTV
jgi:hypothetical protein